MKLKYIFATLVATLALAVGCKKEADQYLKEVQVSSSYLAFPAEGGSVDVVVTATQDWSINTIPEWITATPAYGSVGETQVKFTAIAATETRKAEFTITSGTVGQTMIASQVTQAVEPEVVTVAGALALIKAVDKGDGGIYNVSGTYRVKGIVCKISEISTSYGNATYYLSDDGKFDANTALQVYRGLWLEGGAFTKGDEFAVGDELTIEGQLMSYKGTPETAEKTAFVVSITKSLIGVEGTELLGVEEGQGVTEYPVEGGSIKVYIMTKGNGFHVNIPAEAKSWLHIEDFGTDYVTLSADANEGGDRNVTVGFTTTSGNQTYSCEQALSQKGSIIDATVEKFLAAEVGETQYRVTGVISKVVNATYGNVNLKDYTGEVYVYGIGAKGDFDKLGLKEGDVVTLVGKRADHNGPQMKGAQHESSISVTEADIPTVLAATDGVWYRVTGTIKEIANPTYGNMTITDGTNDLFIYGVYPGYGATGDARKNLVEKLGLKAGDEITVFGAKGTNKGEPQISNGIYWSHKPADEGEGGEGGEGGGEATGAYVQVTSAPSSWAGKYLIVWDNEAHGTANNKDLAKTVDVTVTEGVIAASATVDAAAVTVAAVDGGYSIALGSGKFLTFTAASNQCTFADAASPMNFEYTETGIKVFGVDANSETRYLMKNPNGSNDPVYRGYRESSFIKEGTWQEGWAYPTLYKYVEAN